MSDFGESCKRDQLCEPVSKICSVSLGQKQSKCQRWQRCFAKNKQTSKKGKYLKLCYILVSNAALKIRESDRDSHKGAKVPLDRNAYTNAFSALNKFCSNELICKRRAAKNKLTVPLCRRTRIGSPLSLCVGCSASSLPEGCFPNHINEGAMLQPALRRHGLYSRSGPIYTVPILIWQPWSRNRK